MGKITITPFGVVPKVSTLIVDGDLNLSGYTLSADDLQAVNVHADNIGELTTDAGTTISDLKTDKISAVSDITGTQLDNLGTYPVSFQTVASNEIRLSDDVEIEIYTSISELAKTLTMPAHYTAGVPVKVKWELRTEWNEYCEYDLKLNGTVIKASGHVRFGTTYKVYSYTISDLKPGDVVSLWVNAVSADYIYVRNFAFCASDIITTKQKGLAW